MLRIILVTLLLSCGYLANANQYSLPNNYNRLTSDIYFADNSSSSRTSGGRFTKKKVQKYRDNKNPLIASGLSLLVPGAGEIYGESYIRAGVFMGIEALALGFWYKFEKEGDDNTDNFHKYANKNFSHKNYFLGVGQILSKIAATNTDTTTFPDEFILPDGWKDKNVDISEVMNRIMNPDNWSDHPEEFDFNISKLFKSYTLKFANFEHTLPMKKKGDTWVPHRTQQYYEMIGKYAQFVMGWEDYDGWDPNTVDSDSLRPVLKESVYTNFRMHNSKKRIRYEGKRDDANQAYETGQTFLMFAVLNHVASAFDASYVIKSKYSVTTKVRVQPTGLNNDGRLDNVKLCYSICW